jgi:hypothetical protein
MGSYSFKYGKEAQDEAYMLMKFHFGKEIFHRYDPLKVLAIVSLMSKETIHN